MKYEIWLNNNSSYFGRGIAYMDDERKLSLMSWMHVSSYGRDSVLIDDEENFDSGRFALRWFITNGALDFYRINSDTPASILFHNESGIDIRIDRFGILPNGESITINLSNGQEEQC